MTSGSRRVLSYWLLLLLPTLAVGGGVLWLLGREQTRLDRQTRVAVETREAAVGARARLIAENVVLLVGDVQTGLMSTLLEAPRDDAALTAYLAEWKRTNPLVKATLTEKVDGNARGELARLIAQEKGNAPSVEMGGMISQQAINLSNAGQVNALRQSFNETAQIRGGANNFAQASGWIASRKSGGRLRLIGWRRMSAGLLIGVEVQVSQIAARIGEVLPADREPGEVYELREIGGATYKQKTLSSLDSAVAESMPLLTVPISEAVLPGWEVVGFLRAGSSMRGGGGAFFVLSAVLAGVLVASILAGGALLMRQARRSEEEAAQKTSFVANVSHEFKTPLTTIRLYAELLEQGRVHDAEKRAEYLRTIGSETQRLARLVGNVLDFSRLEEGRKRFDLAEMDLVAEVSGVLDTLAPRVAECGVVLKRDLPAEPLPAKVDRDAIGQILINLVDNACKYAADGGEVAVSLVREAGRGWVLRVGDRGPGVPEKHRELIFEKFHRVNDALTTEKGGAGLGLSIARQLARGFGAELRCVARPGGGAEFVLTLT